MYVKNIIRNILDLLFTVYFSLITVFFYVFYNIIVFLLYPFLWGNKWHLCYALIAKVWASTILFCTGMLPKKIGIKPDSHKSYIYAFNHQSNIDIFFALAILPVGFFFVAKQSLFKMPFLGYSMRNCDYLPINRKSAKEALKTLAKVKLYLDRGRSTLIFPEGTRSKDGNIGKVKRGSIMIAYQTKTELLPIAMDPIYKIQSKGSILIHHQRPKVIFGAPLSFDWEDKSRNSTIAAAELTEKTLNELLKAIRSE